MIDNPIISKELVSVLRSRTALVLTLVAVGALSLLALAMWPASGINPTGALYSRLFLTVILCGQLIMLALFTPPFSATSITHERESNTWELLYYSLLRPRHILVGKLVGAVAFLLILNILSLPAGGACLLMGGVSAREMFQAYLVLLVAGITFGLVGLTCSALMRSSFASLVATYIILLVLCGGVQMPIMLLPNLVPAQPTLHALRCLSPFSALVAIGWDAFRTVGSDASAGVVTRYFTYSGLLCVLMVAILLIRIARRPRPAIARRKGVVDKDTAMSMRVMRRLFFVIDPRRRRRPIPLWLNPVLMLDLRTRAAGVSNLLRACFVCLIFAIGLVLIVCGTWGTTDADLIRLIALAFQIGLIALIGPSLTIAAIAGETEGHTWDQLRMTPMRPWTIFFGKFFGAVGLSTMLLMASAPVFLAILFIQEAIEIRYLTAMFATTVTMIFFTLAAGFFFSARCRTTARAAAWAYGLMAFVTVGSLLGVVLRERLSDTLARFILAFNPIVTVVGTVSDTRFAEFGRWQNNAWALGSVSILLIIATLVRLHKIAGPMD